MTILLTEKEALDRAFKALRRSGHIARQNHCCCGSCSCAKISADVERMPPERRAKIAGAVHYDRQRGDVGPLRKLDLMFGPVEIDDVQYGKGHAEIAAAISEACAAEGLATFWDGDPSRCVEVLFQGAYSPVRIRVPSGAEA